MSIKLKVAKAQQIVNPTPTPEKVPIKPMTTPCSIKIFRTLCSVAPTALRIAISRDFSRTSMISELIMLKAATTTINVSKIHYTIAGVLDMKQHITINSVVQMHFTTVDAVDTMRHIFINNVS